MNDLYVPFERLPRPDLPGALPVSEQPFARAQSLLRRCPDAVTNCLPPPGYGAQWPGTPGQFAFAGLPGFGQIAQLIQQLVAALWQYFGAAPPQAPSRYDHATATSTGDPHLSFDGTERSGAHDTQRFDSMTGHEDLLDSDSFDGGFRIATTVTAPGNRGATMNRSASVITNEGRNRVTLDNAGNATIFANGESLDIAAGQTLDLGNGETVTKDADGALEIVQRNAEGGSIATVFRAQDGGVNVAANATDVDLGGDVVTATATAPPLHPMIEAPLFTPHF